MGCDIHIISEIKHFGQDWQVWQRNPLNVDKTYSSHLEMDCVSGRNYVWFGYLAGVRTSPSRQIAPNRGRPNDISEEAQDWLSPQCYHSITWCTLQELERSIELAKKDLVKNHEYDASDFKSAPSIFVPFDRSDYYNYFDAMPIRRAYEDACAEAEFLGIPNPEIRMIIGFDS
jgi:hypothetical protein